MWPLPFDRLSTCRHNDRHEEKVASPYPEPQKRWIVGFRLPPDVAAEVTAEAAKWNLSLRKLFSEIWTL